MRGQNQAGQPSEAKSMLSEQEESVLKRKQEQNIIAKIERIVEKVVPIHEAEYESENENDMQELIEEISRMDIE